jgi:murein L,D-transpeptidase YcbB/YkuD
MGDLDISAYTTEASAGDGEQIAAKDVTTDVPAPAYETDQFDDVLVEAVKRFQERHGLNTDGVVGPATLRQLNTTPATRAEQLAVNLERLRWMNRDLGDRYILVNLAGFTMSVMKAGREDFTSRVVVGKARRHRTPEFSEMMTHMIVNPSWHVPRSIATEEILPILRKDPTYLDRKGMRLVGGDAPEDWTEVTAGTFPGRIVQRPGSGNALGTVKFMFPNRFSIYLHDTPSKRLFSRDVRAYSHGCVRVEKPEEFAAYLLTGQADDPMAHFLELRERRHERRVNLDNPLPVHLTYRSAWIDEDGTEQFRGDIYGRDAKVADALKRAGVTILQ